MRLARWAPSTTIDTCRTVSHLRVVWPSSAATASRSPAPTAPTPTPPTRTCSPPTLDGLAARYGLEGERLGEVVAGLCSSTPATSTSPVRACWAPGSRPRRPPPTSSRPAAPASRRRSGRQQDRPRPDRRRHRRWHRHHLRRSRRYQRQLRKNLMKVNAARDTVGKLTALARSDRATSGCRPRRTPSHARAVHGGACRADGSRMEGLASEQDALAAPLTPAPRCGLRREVPRRPAHAVPRTRARREPQARLLGSRSSAPSSRSSARGRRPR